MPAIVTCTCIHYFVTFFKTCNTSWICMKLPLIKMTTVLMVYLKNSIYKDSDSNKQVVWYSHRNYIYIYWYYNKCWWEMGLPCWSGLQWPARSWTTVAWYAPYCSMRSLQSFEGWTSSDEAYYVTRPLTLHTVLSQTQLKWSRIDNIWSHAKNNLF